MSHLRKAFAENLKNFDITEREAMENVVLCTAGLDFCCPDDTPDHPDASHGETP